MHTLTSMVAVLHYSFRICMSNYDLHWTIDGISYTCFTHSKYLLVIKAPEPSGHHFADNIHKDISIRDIFFGLNYAFINIPLTAQLYLRLPNDKPTRTTSPKPESRIWSCIHTVYPKKYAHGFCFAVLCCGYTLTDFPISIRLTSLALWQSNDCPSASKATLMNMDKYFMWIHYERLRNHNKAKHNKTVCIFLGIYFNHIPHQTVEFNHSSLPSMWWPLIITNEITVTNEFFSINYKLEEPCNRLLCTV